MTKYINADTLKNILEAKADMSQGTPKEVFLSVTKMVDALPAAESSSVFADLAIKAICEKVCAPTPTQSDVVERCIEVIRELVKELTEDPSNE